MKKKSTIKDIAAKVGISTSSVSMILNQKNISRFSPETIQAVLQTANELNYVLKHPKITKNIIYIICPSIINPYYSTIIQSIEQATTKSNYHTSIHTTYWDIEREKYILESVDKNVVAGIIFTMPPQQPELVCSLNNKVPIVVIGDRSNDLKLDTVDVNNYSSAQILAQHLVELGHRNIAFISTTLDKYHSARTLRYEGLKKVFYDSSVNGTVDLYSTNIAVETEMRTPNIEYNVGYTLGKQCIKKSPKVTAMVAINDMVAYGVIDAVKNAGYKIPNDYSICGFDNILPSKFNGIALTTIDHSIAERGQSAFKLLIEKLSGATTHSNAITRVEYKSNLIIRKTTSRYVNA